MQPFHALLLCWKIFDLSKPISTLPLHYFALSKQLWSAITLSFRHRRTRRIKSLRSIRPTVGNFISRGTFDDTINHKCDTIKRFSWQLYDHRWWVLKLSCNAISAGRKQTGNMANFITTKNYNMNTRVDAIQGA